MEVALVTGGAGFIGSHVCEALLREGMRAASVDNFNDFYDPRIKRGNIRSVENTAALLGGGRFVSIEADICDTQAMDEVFRIHKPDVVVHLAAYAGVRPSIQNPRLYYDVNLGGTLALLECMKAHGVRRMVFASSSSVYGNNTKVPFSEDDPVDFPISPYAATKKSGELLCHVYHSLESMSIACLRFFTVYGPRQRPDLAIHKFTRLIDEDREIPFFGDGSTLRDYTYIDDIVAGVLGAVRWVSEPEPHYEIFNLGESQTISLDEMVRTIEGVLGKTARRRLLPMQPGDVQRTNADIRKSRKMLGYAPDTGFAQGVRRFVEWFQVEAR